MKMKKGKKSGIIGSIVTAIIIGIVIIQFSSINENDTEQNIEPTIIDVDKDGVPDDVDPFIAAPRVWQTSGPFQIDRRQYVLGELVLIRINELSPNEKGEIVFLRQLNDTHYDPPYIEIPFDGSEKITFNQYFKPALSISSGTCSKADLLGNWAVVFRNTNYNNMKFEIVDRIIPGEEEEYEKIIC